ncbi:MAG: CRISPR system precrRNA processing endoribonuclease RAMP protein Cas6 [Pseudoalteromonas sp.]|nr:CRISPR system precrRNA processing endoribonuclease RAMP protein Cas6 [Pseudoalteromonas sp.]
MASALQCLTSQCNLLKLRVYVQFKRECTLPAYKGAMLRGWLGHALKAVDERAFFAFYGNHDDQQPKPYVISPSEDLKTQYQQNEFYYFDILLFGAVTDLAPTLLKAIKHGQSLGFGGQKTPFELVSIASITPSKITAGIETTKLSDWLLPQTSNSLAQTELALHFTTPLRLKVAGNILKNQPPELPLLLKQVARRLAQLCEFWVCDDKELINALYKEQPLLGDHETTAHIYFENWQRYSFKEKSLQPYGGLKGQVSYFGEIAPAIPWLQVGEQLHIGGKSTFGLGKYQLINYYLK